LPREHTCRCESREVHGQSLRGNIRRPNRQTHSSSLGRSSCRRDSKRASVSVPMLTTYYSFLPSVGYSLVLGFLLLPAWTILVTIVQESVGKQFVTSATGITPTLGLVGSAVGPIITGSLIAIFGINQAMMYSVSIPAFAFDILALAVVEK
jgi:MFS family permease